MLESMKRSRLKVVHCTISLSMLLSADACFPLPLTMLMTPLNVTKSSCSADWQITYPKSAHSMPESDVPQPSALNTLRSLWTCFAPLLRTQVNQETPLLHMRVVEDIPLSKLLKR